MARIRDLPLGTYPNGTVSFASRHFPNGMAGFDVRIGRATTADPTIWAQPSTRVKIDLQFSFDGGATFTPIGANTWEGGGGIVSHRGTEQAETVLSWRFHPVEATDVKGQITVTGGPIRTYLDVTVA